MKQKLCEFVVVCAMCMSSKGKQNSTKELYELLSVNYRKLKCVQEANLHLNQLCGSMLSHYDKVSTSQGNSKV